MSLKVNGRMKNILDINSRMRIYANNESFNTIERLRQRELEIQDYLEELREAKLKYGDNNDYIKKIESRFQKWLEYDLKLDSFY